ncbi:single-stranded-DNA-specific exonuclease RecJ [Acidiphilium sp. C61]|uniref:single-stranded-DNA-specific exonuclease RecJ n=1 Tax=Acidiphilium sp. C61 TaxID=1671485 RepID=UPI00157A9FCA|nr:single-stranded-DNA-specific exonuclease RecJ [Acidiphilium sp. C61]
MGARLSEIPPAFGVERSLSGRRWLWRSAEDRIAQAIAQRCGVPDVIGRLLAGRGVMPDRAADFLGPTLRAYLPDPSALTDMDVAASRIADSVQRGATIAIFGDYDVDGACSGALMASGLGGLGARTINYVPDRQREGYGPNAPALLALAAQGAELVVCVDCGTAAHDALAALNGRADAIVLDHHKSEGAPPAIVATVNPNRPDDLSGLGNVCAATISFLALVAVQRELRRRGFFAARREIDLISMLDLVALATVCDVMPLTGLNRALVAQGLKVMARRERPGIAALLDVAQVKEAPGTMTCGFAIGPRINAAGRIDEADLGLRTLLAPEPATAAVLARRLDEINRERQAVEAGLLDQAMAQAEAQFAAGAAVALVAGDQWHPGVVGIIAGRIKEAFNRPALVAGIAEGRAVGSGRSVSGIDLGGAIIAARDAGLLIKGGGHAMAAGFTLEAGRIDALRDFLVERLAAAAMLPDAPDLPIEGTAAVTGIDETLAAAIGRVGPFGAGNEEPVFVVPRARIVRSDRIGRNEKTIRAIVEGETGGRLKTILFRAGISDLAAALSRPGGEPLNLAGHIRAEQWNGRTTVSLILIDASPA